MGVGSILSIILMLATLSIMGTYIWQLPYLPVVPDHSQSLPELSSTEPLELLDHKTGLLNHEGWSVYPHNWIYQQEMSQAYVPIFSRLKNWNYYYFISSKYLVTMAHTNLGLVKGAYINIRNIVDMHEPMIQVRVVDYIGSKVHIDDIKNGVGVSSSIHHDLLNMTFNRHPDDRYTYIEVSGNSEIGKITGKFKVDANDLEGIGFAYSDPKNKNYHRYSYKIPLMEFTGNLGLDGKSLINCSKDHPCLGLHDNVRGFGAYAGAWIWVSTCFEQSGHKISFSFGYSSDNPNSYFDSMFVDGKLYKLDALEMTHVDDTTITWKSQENPKNHPKNRISLLFKKKEAHSLGANFIVYFIDLTSNFGHLSGTIKTKDGHNIEFKDKFAFFEDMHARW
jgi:hypothetical protein